MNGGEIQRRRQRTYDAGYAAGRRWGQIETSWALGYRLPVGILIGLALGVLIEPLARWIVTGTP